MAATYCLKPPCVVRHPLLLSTVWPNPIFVGVTMIGSGSLGGRRRRRRTASLLRIKSSIDNKVFEDQSEGIVCYVDDSGETVCEGYDEGPRFRREILDLRAGEAKIIGLLQRNWIQLINAKDVYLTDDSNGAELAARQEFNQNGYNFN